VKSPSPSLPTTGALTKETRTISSLAIDYNQRVADWNPSLGANGVTKIEAYDEVGQMAYVPWFAIYVGNEIVRRVNAVYVVEVVYATE
jgi:hypothetical protein